MNITIIKNIIFSATLLITVLALGACQSDKDPQTTQEEANLQKAIYCMDLLENQKDLDASRRECFGETYIQHTPWISDGVDVVLSIFANRFEKYPDFAMEIKRTAADGDLVWLHLHTKRTPDDRGNAVINIFRMKDGKFVEHWNVGQAVPEKSANDNTMF
ncbi:MAG: nuclear transport factor 2 family protein [Alcanivoracaceae bacterium]|nr:nuclear transport factor 2 family protein [Alcanivoracaceae bacterium]